MSDDEDIKRELRLVYCRGNLLLRKFRQCSEDVKLQLFRSYCNNLYCCSLWCQYTKEILRKLKVAYNNTFRLLFNVRDVIHISNLFMNLGLDTTKVIIRKSVSSLFKRLDNSCNSVIQTIIQSGYFMFKSNLFTHWRKIAFCWYGFTHLVLLLTVHSVYMF